MSVIVFGGGFRGLVTSYLLAKKGYKVDLLCEGKSVGGVLNGINIGSNRLDLGCHTFDNNDDETTDILFSMGGGSENFSPVKLNYSSLNEFGNVDRLSRYEFMNYPKIDLTKLQKEYLLSLFLGLQILMIL